MTTSLTKGTRTSRAIAGMLTSILQYALLMVLQFLLAPVVLKYAGQEALGSYSFLMQIISWAALTDLGFGVATGRNLAQAHGIDDQRKLFSSVFTTGRTFYLGSNLAFAIVVLLIGWKVNSFMTMSYGIETQARLSLFLLAIWIAVRTPLSLYGDALIATQNLASSNVIVALSNTLRLLLSLSLILMKTGLVGLMMAYIIAEAFTLTVQRMWYYRLYRNDKFGWGIPDRVLFKEMLKFGFTYMVMIVAGRLSLSTDSIIIGYLQGAAAISIYYVTQMPATFVYQFIWRFADNAVPALNELYAKRALPQLSDVYLRLLRYSILAIIPLAIGIVGFNRIVISLWVGKVQYAGEFFSIALAFFAITQVINHLNALVMVVFGAVRPMAIFGLCGGVLKVSLAFWLGRIIGLPGVMRANTLLDVPVLIYFSYLSWHLLELPIRQVWQHALLPTLPVCIMTLLLLIVQLIRPLAETLPELFFWISLYAFIWILGTIAFGLVQSERDNIRFYIKRTFALVK